MSWLCGLGWVIALITIIYFITYKCLNNLGQETTEIKWINKLGTKKDKNKDK